MLGFLREREESLIVSGSDPRKPVEKQIHWAVSLQARRLQFHLNPLRAVWYLSHWYPTLRVRWLGY